MIDSHCHWDFNVFAAGRSAQLEAFAAAGISHLVLPGVAPSQWPVLEQLTQRFSQAPCRLLAAFGVHPWWGEQLMQSDDATQWQTCIVDYIQQHGVAIGECGLDGSLNWAMSDQCRLFEWHLQLACELKRPLLIHAHKAHNPVLRQLNRYKPPKGGVIHGFSGSLELAQQYWRRGFYIGVGGTITYPRAQKTRRAIASMPIESLLLETDAPDMPLQGFQGQPNSPQQLPLVAQALADLQKKPLTLIKQQTTLNARQLFGLTESDIFL